MERDHFGYIADMELTISTHTLTWSVTDTLIENLPAIIISTHTLTWSVTVRLAPKSRHTRISTHTLTWSVTKRRN